MTPMEFMARLSALTPPPRSSLVRYHGVLAPNSPWRVAVVPLPPGAAEVGDGPEATATERVGEGGTREVSTKWVPIDWARLLWRVWGVDALKCPACDGRMKMIAAVTERVGIVHRRRQEALVAVFNNLALRCRGCARATRRRGADGYRGEFRIPA
jgi:hypothetical protein